MAKSNQSLAPLSISYEQLTQSWRVFEAQILALLDTLDLADKALFCDHVALRVNSIASADALQEAFSRLGNIISDNVINGRPILIIELDTPLTLGQFSIDCVELPYPSDKAYPQEGWEHIELVIESTAEDCQNLSQDLMTLCPTLRPLLQPKQLSSEPEFEPYKAIKVKMSSPKGDKERLANPTIAFKRGNVCIKVHSHGIKTVIASEQQT